MLIWPLAYFFPMSFWHVILISSFLTNTKNTNTRAFRSKGAICPNIPVLTYVFFLFSRLDIYHTSLLSMFVVSTKILLPGFRCQVPIEHMQSFCQPSRSYINQRAQDPRIRRRIRRKKKTIKA